MENQQLQDWAINTIRFLAVDAVQTAESGHPGLPMGTAAIAYTLWTRQLRHNPDNPSWFNRDRFILSGGHGSMLIYALLHLTGYDLPMDELKRFRQWGSKTPGHPEYGMTPGVEATTGPLGQGFANGVGMAMAEAHLAAIFNKPGFNVIDHYTYAIVTDGDLMEGVAAEAASLAGHLKLGKLVYFYDDNQITIEGSTDLAFTEDLAARFSAYGWQVLQVANGNDVDEIDRAIQAAKEDPRPSLIICKTIIGYGMPNRQGTHKAHSDPPGWPEIEAGKQQLGYPLTPKFYVPPEVGAFYRQARMRGPAEEIAWERLIAQYVVEYPSLGIELRRRIAGILQEGWKAALPVFPPDAKGMASRVSSGKVINALAPILPELFGGSADLAPSNKTWIDNSPAFQPNSLEGRNVHYGVREHAMGAAINGMALHGGVRPFGGTFLVFSDYMRPAIRLAALSHIPAIWVFTHDSVGVGEDGPTHQPVEHIASLRAMPNLLVFRPADANETVVAWRCALEENHRPTALILTRQNLPTLDRVSPGTVFADAENAAKGAYTLAEWGLGIPDVLLLSAGSEVHLVIQAAEMLAKSGVNVKVVSMPCWERFEEQSQAYQDEVLPPEVIRRVALEAGVTQGWHRWAGSGGIVIGLEQFGASAPAETVYKNLGLTADRVFEAAKSLLSQV